MDRRLRNKRLATNVNVAQRIKLKTVTEKMQMNGIAVPRKGIMGRLVINLL